MAGVRGCVRMCAFYGTVEKFGLFLEMPISKLDSLLAISSLVPAALYRIWAWKPRNKAGDKNTPSRAKPIITHSETSVGAIQQQGSDNVINVVNHVNALNHSSPSASSLTPEVLGITKRFNEVLKLMNEQRKFELFTVADLAKEMELESVGVLEKIFVGQNEPNFEFIERFCNCFGINRNWLEKAESKPFAKPGNEEGKNYATDFIGEIGKIKPGNIYFIRTKSESGEVFLVLQFSLYRYKIVGGLWPIRGNVGTRGNAQILNLYDFLLFLKSKHVFILSRILDDDSFMRLYEGSVFPGNIISNSRESDWADDFMDVDHEYAHLDYLALYGDGFMRAQEIVRQRLARDKSRLEV